MAVMYRAMWVDDPLTLEGAEEAVARAHQEFSRWVMDDQSAQMLPEGESDLGGHRLATVHRFATDAGPAFDATVVDKDAPGRDERWSTTVRVWADGDVLWTWVDNQFETDNAYARVAIGAPRVVDALLGLPGAHRLGPTSLHVGTVPVALSEVQDFIAALQDPDRALAIVVFTEPPGAVNDNWRLRAAKCARRLAGIAQVRTMDVAAVAAFRDRLGDLAVWGGGIRTYNPGPISGSEDGFRHRYIPHYRLGNSEQGVATLLVNRVAPMSIRRRPPSSASVVWPATQGDAAALRQTEQERDHYQFQYELAIQERQDVESELSRAQGHLDRVVGALRAIELEGLFWENQTPADENPDEVEDTTQAFLWAQEYLTDGLSVPDEAAQELDRIDSAPESRPWGNNAWRGLRSLAAYVQARRQGYEGGFWSWCERGEARAWPATSKKLAMVESETVRNNSRLMAARRFVVDPRVDPSGWIHMEAHLKISEGGGDLAPRIYFHDDTGGATGKVHIGFIGPHFLVPNTKS